MYHQKIACLSLLLIAAAGIFSGCASLPQYNPEYTSVPETISAAGTDAPETVPESIAPETTVASILMETEPSAESVTAERPAGTTSLPASLLTAPEDIALHETEESGQYQFTYGSEIFSAVYTTNHWKVIDSCRITNPVDIQYICEALRQEHPIPSADYKGWRTAEDMAYEWQQHNLAHALLPENSEWRSHTQDVDLNPEDQGKSLYDLYRERTGRS